MMRYGEEGDQFYLLLNGTVSVWVPVTFKQMAEPVKKFKEMVNKELREVRGDDQLVKKHKLGEYSKLTQLPFEFKEMRRLGELDDFFKVEQEQFMTEKTKVNGVPWKTLKQDAMQKHYREQEWFVSQSLLLFTFLTVLDQLVRAGEV